jgi:hypothetical protein
MIVVNNMLIVPTLGNLNQQGWPRLVWELSIMSSRTRKYAWSWKYCREIS